MKSFEYFSPNSLAEACNLLAERKDNSRVLAGGTDVLIELRRSNAAQSNAIIDISRISTLKGIEESGDSIVIRPLTTHAEVLRSQIIGNHAPLLRVAVSTIGSPQIRNRGTVGGNIINAAACADTVPPLIALDAQVRLKSANEERVVPLADFFIRPYVTVARRDEILVEIRFPKLPADTRSSFVKLGRRNALSIARLSVATIVCCNASGVVTDARIVPGAAFPRWRRVSEGESVMLGRKLSKELAAEAGRKVSEAMISVTGRRWSTEYKEPVIAVLVRRALETCMERTGRPAKS
jgi:CO/xanthine dehydrogenase FAD-binding subunit